MPESGLVIVLGMRLSSDTIGEELAGRIDIGIKLMVEEEANFMIVSGGYTNPEINVSEALAMRKYAMNKGVPEKSIIIEEQSIDTIGNGFFSRKLVDSMNLSHKIFVVTSCYHVQRTKYIFDHYYGDDFILNYDRCYNAFSEKAQPEESKFLRTREFFNEANINER